MVPDFVVLYSLVIVLFCLAYFSMASVPFLFVRLEIPEVARLLRGLFDAYFWMVGVAGFVATTVCAASGRKAFAVAMLLLAGTAVAVRRTVLHRIDAQQIAWRSGDIAAMRRLRLLHCGGMLANILILGAVASSVRFII